MKSVTTEQEEEEEKIRTTEQEEKEEEDQKREEEWNHGRHGKNTETDEEGYLRQLNEFATSAAKMNIPRQSRKWSAEIAHFG